MNRNEDGWISLYKERGALWFHDGNQKRPHALLTSGKHSSGFFNSELVMEDPLLLDDAAHDLTELIGKYGTGIHTIDRVVGPAMGAITLAHDIARHISQARRGHGTQRRPCLRAYIEKAVDGEQTMVFKRTSLHPTELVLIVEDVLTTGSSVYHTATAVAAAHAYVAPIVAVLVNRSGLTEVLGMKIIALINRPMPIWQAEECPLCKAGSEAIRPKGKENWDRLNATY